MNTKILSQYSVKSPVINHLVQSKCIKVGRYKLKSGKTSKYYFDMRNLISHPQSLCSVGDSLNNLLLDCDLICGVPMGGIPIASYISTKYNIPMIMIRDSVKDHGTQKQIEGEYKKDSKCILIDDVITSGQSVQKVVDWLGKHVDIVQVAVILDRQEQFECTVPVQSLLTKTDIIKYKLIDVMEKKKSKLCFSADLTDPIKILSILNDIGPKIVLCKLHMDIIGWDNFDQEVFIQKLIEIAVTHDFLIMEDRKFIDISSIVSKQYSQYKDWVDLVTVHACCNDAVIKELNGVVLVANMSNNPGQDFSERAEILAANNESSVVGFVSQHKIGDNPNFLCMTPGVNFIKSKIGDQNYRSPKNIDTDIFIVGRAIYDAPDIISAVNNFTPEGSKYNWIRPDLLK